MNRRKRHQPLTLVIPMQDKDRTMLREIAIRINELSKAHEIGRLQDIRKKIKGFDRRPSSSIFSEATIDKNDGWAFHHGGRRELQFNIGDEEEGLRYGIALSLEASRTLPDISYLYPKAKRLNQFIRLQPDFFSDYKMWWWTRDKRSEIGVVKEIPEALLKPHTFIFLGKIQSTKKIDFESILTTFDDLLKPYIFVEKGSGSGILEFERTANEEFIFSPKSRSLPKRRDYTLEQRAIDLNVRHTLIQEALVLKLINKYGQDQVSVENPFGGKNIDEPRSHFPSFCTFVGRLILREAKIHPIML